MTKKISKTETGFSLIEVLIAITVFSIGILAVITMQTTSIGGNGKARQITEETTLAADRIDTLLGLTYSGSVDVDGDGTNQVLTNDTNGNGKCDLNENCFGLNDITAATADGNVISPDGAYTIYWNVAVDVPFRNMKTVRVIVINNFGGTQTRVPIDFIKGS